MERVQTTLRLEQHIRAGLELIGSKRGMTLNKLMNLALQQFVAREVESLEAEASDTLARLRSYRDRDPDFTRAIEAVVEAEASAGDDPAEGKIVGDAKTRPSLTGTVADILDA